MHRFVFLILFALVPALRAQQSSADAGQLRLYPRDLVRVTVQGEPDMAVERQIDAAGEVNVPLIGSIKVAGHTIAEAQQLIAERYMRDEIFIQPEVVFTVVKYASKEVTLLGQIGSQGKVPFPAEMTTLSLVEAIASAGGLTRIAKGDAVRVTRRDQRGVEQVFTLNVDKMIDGRGAAIDVFLLLPGDIVFVPERVF